MEITAWKPRLETMQSVRLAVRSWNL